MDPVALHLNECANGKIWYNQVLPFLDSNDNSCCRDKQTNAAMKKIKIDNIELNEVSQK